MSRIVFTVLGDRVQNVGYRRFLLSAMRQRGLVGFVTNLSDGKQVSLEVWGGRHDLNDFYEFVRRQKPSGAGKVTVGFRTMDAVKRPKSFDLLNEKMDLMIEQTGKFVEEGKMVGVSLRGIHKTLKKMPKAVGAELKDSLKQTAFAGH